MPVAWPTSARSWQTRGYNINRIPKRAAALAAVLAVLALLAAACGGGSDSASDQSSNGVFVVKGSSTKIPLANGSTAQVGPYTAQLSFSDYPPKQQSTLTVYLTDTASGSPVGEAGLTVLPSMPMPGQEKGFLTFQAVPDSRPGYYSVALKFPMSGAWDAELDVQRGGQTAALNLFARVQS